jgi:hypothetical protein
VPAGATAPHPQVVSIGGLDHAVNLAMKDVMSYAMNYAMSYAMNYAMNMTWTGM